MPGRVVGSEESTIVDMAVMVGSFSACSGLQMRSVGIDRPAVFQSMAANVQYCANPIQL